MPDITLSATAEVVDTLCSAFGHQSGNKGAFLKGKIKEWLKEKYTAQKIKDGNAATQAAIAAATAQLMADAAQAKTTAETTAESSIT